MQWCESISLRLEAIWLCEKTFWKSIWKLRKHCVNQTKVNGIRLIFSFKCVFWWTQLLCYTLCYTQFTQAFHNKKVWERENWFTNCIMRACRLFCPTKQCSESILPLKVMIVKVQNDEIDWSQIGANWKPSKNQVWKLFSSSQPICVSTIGALLGHFEAANCSSCCLINTVYKHTSKKRLVWSDSLMADCKSETNCFFSSLFGFKKSSEIPDCFSFSRES